MNNDKIEPPSNKNECTQKPAPEDSDKSSGELTIVCDPDERSLISKLTEKRKRKRKRKRIQSSSSSGDEFEDKSFEETIEKCAAKNNMTPDCVKKLLKKLVMNDHVLAIVRIKEEEDEKIALTNSVIDEDDEEEDNENMAPKLTRFKAKQLNKPPLPIAPLKVSSPDAEVAALIQAELVSDDDDEEYKPGDEEIHSDDEMNNTISDADSNPRTPATPLFLNEIDDDAQIQETLYTNDGLFKIPKTRNDSVVSLEEQENIARRTRSKLSLSTTAIETLESTFIPPDITTDMYDFDCDMDHVWKEFLNEFTKPLNTNHEEDDDTDPEYVAADKVPIDKEELREVRVSKKELNELVAELLEMSGFMDENALNDATMLGTNVSNETSCIDIDTTPQPSNRCKTPRLKKQRESDIKKSTCDVNSKTSFIPYSSSTPIQAIPVQKVQPNVARELNFTTNPIISVANNDVLPISLVNTLQLSGHPMQQLSQVYYQISTPDISSYFAYNLPTNPCHSAAALPFEAQTKPVSKNERRYRFLHNLVPVNTTFPEGHVGFTNYQLQLLQQQLQIHVQFSTQTFIQTYAHPEFWKQANTFKNYLLEMQKKAQPNLSFDIWNLKLAIEFCNNWEKELLNESEENNEMIKFIINQMENSKQREVLGKSYHCNFHPKIMEYVLNSQVFMYPKLLPQTAFRQDIQKKKHDIIKSEELLICLGLELFYEIAKNDLNKYKPAKEKHPSQTLVCKYISKYLCPTLTEKHINAFICHKRLKSDTFNAIKYYYQHKKAPPFQHVYETIDFNNVLAPGFYQKGILPYIWDEYSFCNKRIAKLSNQEHKSPKDSPIKTSQCQNKLDVNHSEKKSLKPTSSNSSANIKINIVYEEESRISEQEQCTQDKVVFPSPNLEINPNFLNHSYKVVPNPKLDQSLNLTSYLSNFNVNSSTSGSSANVTLETDQIQGSGNLKCACCCKCDKSVKDVVHKNQTLVTDFFKTDQQVTSANESGLKLKSNKTKVAQRRNQFLNHFYEKSRIRRSNASIIRNIDIKGALKRKSIKLKSKLYKIFYDYNFKYDKANFISKNNTNKIINRVYRHFKTIDFYTDFLVDLRIMSSNMKKCKTSDTDSSTDERSSKRNKSLNFDKFNVVNMPPFKRILKPEENTEKDSIYAYNYCEQVEETLTAADKIELYEKFLEILQNFNEKENKVVELYLEIEKLFLPEHPELADLFLTFLLPGQAAQIGKFFEHFILSNMNTFLQKLNIYFNKQPAQIKKIYTCLNELANETQVTMDMVKAKILPLLKGNPLLTEWFLQMFPSEKPPDSSSSDYEVLSVKKTVLDSPDSMDVYEELSLADIIPDAAENAPCATKYIQGRIIYGVLPAKLSFLAHDSNPVNDSLDYDSSHSNCVHDIRKYGEATLHEKNKSTSEADMNLSLSGNEEHDADVHEPESKSVETEQLAKFKLCDETVLKAHAIRLNPFVHATKGEKYSDVVHLLTIPSNQNERNQLSDEEFEKSMKNSPKKQQNKATASGSKAHPAKKRITSPNAVKKGKSSPNHNKKVVSIASDSKALATSKKLKNFIEDEDEKTSISKKKKERAAQVKKPNVPVEAVPSTSQNIPSSSSSSTPLPPAPPPQPPTDVQQPQNAKEINWTRDEDKVILEEIKNGFNVVDELIARINLKLSNRLPGDIQARYEFLMEVLQKFQKSDSK